MNNSVKPFMQQLDERAVAIDSLLCVGLDPHPELLRHDTPDGIRDFCFRLIDATHDVACAFKPNAAFFERPGGYEVLQAVIAHVPDGIPVILDAKRGDIPSTAAAYARSAFEYLGASAITVNPYMGLDAVEPFLQYSGKGVFVLCKTTNPGQAMLQDQSLGALPAQIRIYEYIALKFADLGRGDAVGYVVGADGGSIMERVRGHAPEAWFLVPGIGAQGGDLEMPLLTGLREDGRGLLINASRSIAAADSPRAEAVRLRDAIRAVRERFSLVNRTRSQNPESPVRRVAGALAATSSVQFGSFTLKSGKESPIYLDLRRLIADPFAMQGIAEALWMTLKDLKFDHIAALPYAALPIGTVTALIMGRSLIYPRREAKDYGTKASVEGVFKAGDVAIVLDDLATTGETKFEMIERLKAAGLVVRDVVVVVDREQGAAETLSAAGYNFHAVAKLTELLDAWEQQGTIRAEQRREVDDYLRRERKQPPSVHE